MLVPDYVKLYIRIVGRHAFANLSGGISIKFVFEDINDIRLVGVSAGCLIRRLLRYHRLQLWVPDSSMSLRWT